MLSSAYNEDIEQNEQNLLVVKSWWLYPHTRIWPSAEFGV